MGRRPKKVDAVGEKEESSNTFQTLTQIQELGFSQEEIVEMLVKARKEAEEASADKDNRITPATVNEENQGSESGKEQGQRRNWADLTEESGEAEGNPPQGVEADRKTWADIARGNRNPENGVSLKYVKPGEIVKFTMAELNEGAKLWNNTLVGMVIGASPSYIEVAKYARAAWQCMGLGRVHQMQKGVFMFEFRSQAEKTRVLEGKWAMYNRFQLLLKPWQGNVSIKDHFDRIPIWIQLPNLNQDLWAPANLGKVASYVGYPITTDECTAVRSRVDYARVLVEVPFMGELPDQIPIQDEEGPVYYQKVVYEWKPVTCEVCGWFGHDKARCKRKKEEQGDTEKEGGERKVIEEGKGKESAEEPSGEITSAEKVKEVNTNLEETSRVEENTRGRLIVRRRAKC